MWPKLTQGYKMQDAGSAQSGNNLLGLIKAAHSQVSWADIKGININIKGWANSYLDV